MFSVTTPNLFRVDAFSFYCNLSAAFSVFLTVRHIPQLKEELQCVELDFFPSLLLLFSFQLMVYLLGGNS
jgi:hypothetical protein